MDLPNREEISFHKTTASVVLDLVRGLAAILVLLQHWKAQFFLDYPKIPGHRAWFAVPYVVCSAGHQSVIIFFVLSGFLIGGSIFRSYDRNQWGWDRYLTHRFVRLWVVLLPGLILGGLLDWIGLHFSSGSNIYNGTEKSHLVVVSQTLAPSIMLGNAAFLQTILVPVFGSNAALWSLANEFWYYILFPLGWLGWKRETPTARRVLYLLLLFAFAWLVGEPILLLFPVWLAGVLLTRLPALKVGGGVRIGAAVIYVPIIFLFAKGNFLSAIVKDYIFGAITLGFFWIMLSARKEAPQNRLNTFARQISRFSYTLYVAHMAPLLLLTSLVVGQNLWSPTDLPHSALAIAVLVVVIVYAWCVAAVTEFHTDWVRSRIERTLGILAR